MNPPDGPKGEYRSAEHEGNQMTDNQNPIAGTQALPPLVQSAGVPFDLFIQALTEQLDKTQATMALKARFGKLPMTFAVKDVSLDLRAFVQIIDDDVYVRPAGPGDVAASTIKLALTTITRSMIEENAMSFHTEDPKFSLREALGDRINEEEQRRLERLGVRSIGQLNELRQAAGADVVARLARMPVNRLQQAMLAAAAPRVTHVTQDETELRGTLPRTGVAARPQPSRVHLEAPMLRSGSVPTISAAGMPVPVVRAQDQSLVLQPLAHQLGCMAEVDFGAGQVASLRLTSGSVGAWHDVVAQGQP